MSYRRPIPHRVNPSYVPPSRHTIFIRGLPGSTNVDSVKNHFCQETDTKCTVEFFSTSDDKAKFSVAIRFKSHELAREMLTRYNGKELFGHPIEVTWFKDLKKARARAYEEQRHSRFRSVRGFRGNRGYQDRRVHGYSPGHGRERSYSGGPPSSRRFSRGLSGSSHCSSRSHSGSPKRRSNRRSRSLSSRSRSSSRSVSNRSYQSNHAAPERRSGQIRSPSHYSNAPAPSTRQEHGDTNLLNDLIHLQSKNVTSKPSRYRNSHSHSRSGSSTRSQSTSAPRRQQNQRHLSPVLPNLILSKDQSPEKNQSSLPNLSGSNWRPLSLTEEMSTDEPEPARSLFAAYSGSSNNNNSNKPRLNGGKIILSPLVSQKHLNERSLSEIDNISHSSGERERGRKRNESGEMSSPMGVENNHSFSSSQLENSSQKSKDVLIQERKAVIEEEYKKECETFATVAKVFISKDGTLEDKLLPLLKTILHERGQQSVEELRLYIYNLETVNGRA
nr:Dentin sialophosphoprotein [Hymenolepis microstoma]